MGSTFLDSFDNIVTSFLGLLLFYVFLVFVARRFRDIGYSAWYSLSALVLLGLFPSLGSLVFFTTLALYAGFMFLFPGSEEENRFGNPPKGLDFKSTYQGSKTFRE
jgi:uncharacterized membrane protein YhaH (DUF805 family)